MKKMKTFFVLIGVVGSIAFSSFAMAADPVETVELATGFEISKCTASNVPPSNGGTVGETCEAFSSLPTTNIAIVLNGCSTAGGSTFCFGSWNETRTRDGHSFIATINVTKNTNVFGGMTMTSYALSATVGSAVKPQQMNSIEIYLSKAGVLSDSVSFNGSNFVSPITGDSYTPSLLITPKTPGPGQN
jgi:hypothetical protein